MTFEYIEGFYNRKRRHSTVGSKAPMPCLSDGRIAQEQKNLVA